MRKLLLAVLALATLALPGLGEEAISGDVDEAPAELGEVDLFSPEAYGEAIAPEPEPTEPPAAEKKRKGIPWYTSFNYPEDKIFFEDEIWSILTCSWGLEDFQAAGLMGSIYAESSFCPYNAQRHESVDDRGKYRYRAGDGVGFGLCQWTSSGRKAGLAALAERHGSDELVWDFDVQMEFLKGELDFEALRATKTLYDAAEWAVLRYERPNQKSAHSWPGTRYEYARRIYGDHAGREYDEPKLAFAVDFDGEASPEGFLLDADGEGAVLTVASNYYWRLSQRDSSLDGWLGVEAADFYHPEQTVECVCGYACEGEKPLTLTVLEPPLPGETLVTTLRFEAFRGDHEVIELPVSVTGPGEWLYGPWTDKADARLIRERMARVIERLKALKE